MHHAPTSLASLFFGLLAFAGPLVAAVLPKRRKRRRRTGRLERTNAKAGARIYRG